MILMQIWGYAGMFLLPLIAALIPIFIGQQFGLAHVRKNKELADVPMESVVTASFGLLAFMLAFTFQIAANRWEGRKTLLYSEVQEIRTAYLRAGLLPEPFNSGTKKNLMEYVNLRVGLAHDISQLDQAIKKSRVILDTLWSYTESLAAQDRSSEVYSLYTGSINQVIDAFHQRITISLVYRIHPTIIIILGIAVFISMLLLGYQFGVAGKGNNGIKIMLAILFSTVMFLIIGLDRPETGVVKVNQKPFLELHKQLMEKENFRMKTSTPSQ